MAAARVRRRLRLPTPITAAALMSNCADPSQPGVASILHTLSGSRIRSIRTARPAITICSTTITPAISATAPTPIPTPTPSNYVFTMPPSTVRTIGDALHREAHLLGLLRRPVERLSRRQVPAGYQRHGRVLQHLQLGPSTRPSIMTNPARAHRSHQGHHRSL